jgi:hypothetical protein
MPSQRVNAPKISSRKSGNSARIADRKSHGRDRVSNGRDVLPNTDGRLLIAKRYKTIASAIAVDSGGSDACSEAKLQLIRRFAAAAVLAEQMESRLANGEEINVERHALLVSSMVRITRQLGLGRVAKDVTLTLDQYLHSKQEAAE